MRRIRTVLAALVVVTFLLSLGVALLPRAVELASTSSAQCNQTVLTSAVGAVTSSSCDAELASRVQELLPSAVEAVSDILDIGRVPWSRRVDVVIPASDTELVSLVGPAFADMAGIAIRDGTVQRVVINRVRAAPLSELELGVLLRHEITHVATRDLTSDSAPLWLVEGFADWVAFRGQGLSLRSAAPLLTADVSGLPADFGGPGRDLAYQQAYSIMVFLESRLGEQGVVEFFLQYAPRSAVDPAAVDVAGWREFLRSSIG